MFVCNVGDSRAILAQRPRAPEPAPAPPDATAVTAPNGAAVTGRNGAELRVFPLSEDQTPYRRDERERVKRCGARVLSMDQMAGFEPLHEKWGDVRLGEAIDEAGDPPRVWSKYGEYPGTAFTRSLGDSIAEELGVYAVPEITVRKISPRDQYVMVASDGVYEFLTNKQCIQTLHEHSDPLAATQALARKAFDLWLSYEIRSDDITLICLFMDHVGAGKKEGEGAGEEGEEEEEDPAWSLKTVRPLRSPRGREGGREGRREGGREGGRARVGWRRRWR
ncbi:cgmp-dependent protein [Nannochloropsis gaditana]|uniref:Cgmp-dependent protein n=1 Tax=Nannochloropsis gaditana TaxID=72520 RepID=W7TI45_9STRA|nr:cgmp-dependent protein [Nannochloropsis gaditana]